MSGPFKNYYVYIHKDPKTSEVVYVGHGCRERAWNTRNRDEAHKGWMEQLMARGLVPSDWSFVIERGLDKKTAAEYERAFLAGGPLRFNKNYGEKLLKLSEEQIDAAKWLRSQGCSYKSVGEQLGVAAMTVHRILSGKSLARERRIVGAI